MLNEMMIRCFLSLCQTRNFTHTASNLFLSQQAVSHNISKLEQELGTTLFQRNSRGAAPTEYALRYQEAFLWLAGELEAIRQEIQQDKQPFQEIHIGYQLWLDFGRAPYRTLNQLHRENPNVRYRVERYSPADLNRMLGTGEIECAIMYERFCPRQGLFPRRKIIDTRHVMLIAMDYPGLTHSSSYLDMCHEPLIFDSLEESSTANAVRDAREFSAKIGLKPRNVILKPTRESAYTAVEQGMGVIVTTEANRIIGSASYAKLPMDSSEALMAVWNENANEDLVKQYIATLSRELVAAARVSSALSIE